MFLLVWYVPFYPSVSSTSLSHLLFFNFSPIPETFRHHFDTILVRRTLKCLIMVVLFRALENESRYSILIAINYYAIYFDCILNCINCSKSDLLFKNFLSVSIFVETKWSFLAHLVQLSHFVQVPTRIIPRWFFLIGQIILFLVW